MIYRVFQNYGIKLIGVIQLFQLLILFLFRHDNSQGP